MAYPECIRGEGPIVETITALAEDSYFTGLEISWIKDDNSRSEVRSILQQAGIKYTYGAQPTLLTQGLDLNHSDAGERAKAVRQVRECINEAGEVGASALAVLSGKTSEDIPAATDRFLESMYEICEYARAMPISIEAFDRVPFGKNCLIGPTTEAVAVCAKIRKRYPNCGLMLDLSHLPLLGERPKETLRVAKEYLVHAHMGNCAMRDPAHPAYGDEHPYLGIEGGENGIPELTDYLEGLIEIGYLSPGGENILSFEVKPIKSLGHTSALAIANSKRALQSAWGNIRRELQCS